MDGLSRFHLIVAVFAVCLQIQVSIFAKGDYLGLRVNLADVLLPVACIGMIYYVFAQKGINWPKSDLLKWIFCLAFLFVVMSVSLVNGYVTNGFLSGWAFVNKYVGYIMLACYFCIGGWIAVATGGAMDIRTFLVRVTVFFFLFVFALSIVAFLMQMLSPVFFGWPQFPWAGFMANRNAYMLLAVLVMCFIVFYDDVSETPIPRWAVSLFWFLMPAFWVYNASRAGWFVMAILILYYAGRSPLKKLRYLLPLLVAGSVFSYGLTQAINITDVSEATQFRLLVKLIQPQEDEEMYMGDMKRLIALEDGLELYSQSNPILGAGLGAYKPFQINKRGEFIEVIDFTGLWLLVETGILGLLSFSGFFVLCIGTVFKQYKSSHDSFYLAYLVFLMSFAAMSLLHEFMYTRFVWFFLGMAVAPVSVSAGRWTSRS